MRLIPTFEPKSPKSSFGKWMAVIILVALVILTPILWWHNQRSTNVTPIDAEKQLVIERIRLAYPIDKSTKVERINDIQLAKQLNPTVYANAKAGDWMIETREVIIIYRPSENKIVSIANKL